MTPFTVFECKREKDRGTECHRWKEEKRKKNCLIIANNNRRNDIIEQITVITKINWVFHILSFDEE